MKIPRIFRPLGLIIASMLLILALQISNATAWTQSEGARQFKEITEGGEPAFTIEEAHAIFKEMIPLVENATGKKFSQVPKIQSISTEKLVDVLTRELQLQFSIILHNLDENQLVAASKNQAILMATRLLGKYDPQDEVLYLIPGNIFPIFKMMKIDKTKARSLIKLLVAHELTHALQDQEIGFNKMVREITGLEEFEAYNATIEGHAVFVQELIGKHLKLDDEVLEFSKLLAGGLISVDDPAIDIQNRVIAKWFEQVYIGGKKFIEYHYRQGGNNRLWKILSEPPVDTGMILQPDTYSNISLKKPNFSKIFLGMENFFGKRNWNVNSFEMTKFRLASAYANIEPHLRVEIISNIVCSQLFRVNSHVVNELKKGTINILTLKDELFGPKYISTMENTVKKNVKKIESSNIYKIENISIKPFLKINADSSHKIEISLITPEGKIIKDVAVRICRKNILLEITATNIDLSDKTFIEIAETIFIRYHEAKELQGL